MAAVALLHSPLTSASAWGDLPDELRSRGHVVAVPQVDEDDRPPFAVRYIAAVSTQLRADLGELPAFLVPHSGAGPLVAQVAFARRAQGVATPGYALLDAGVPRTSRLRSRLDQLAIEDKKFALSLRESLDAGGVYPNWSDDDLRSEVPDSEARAGLVAGLRPRDIRYFDEELPLPDDWPDAPVAYIRTSGAYDAVAATARQRNWPVVTADLGHFAALVDPVTTAHLIESAIDAIS